LGETLPVLRWCPTGQFTFLPIHAASCFDGEQAIECASDYFISSYIPTISSILDHESPVSAETFKMIAVIQSHDLPSMTMELANIRQHVPHSALTELGVSGVPARVEDVAACLPGASVVHFACHGIQDSLEPLKSGLKLDDGLLQISRIMKEKMPNGALAFLCAGETAKGDVKLPDEVLSLGASMIFSGFQRVVATMW
jgi:CHAT domain-containing protein